MKDSEGGPNLGSGSIHVGQHGLEVKLALFQVDSSHISLFIALDCSKQLFRLIMLSVLQGKFLLLMGFCKWEKLEGVQNLVFNINLTSFQLDLP